MVKRAPVNVRYLWLFGEHILTRSFTARDPNKTIHEIDRAEIAGDVVGSDTAWQRPYIDNLMFWPCRDLCAGGALRTSAAQSRMLGQLGERPLDHVFGWIERTVHPIASLSGRGIVECGNRDGRFH